MITTKNIKMGNKHPNCNDNERIQSPYCICNDDEIKMTNQAGYNINVDYKDGGREIIPTNHSKCITRENLTGSGIGLIYFAANRKGKKGLNIRIQR